MNIKAIKITGASQKIQFNGQGECEACYVCHKCENEFACSNSCEDEQTAREESDVHFDIQHARIDELEAKVGE